MSAGFIEQKMEQKIEKGYHSDFECDIGYIWILSFAQQAHGGSWLITPLTMLGYFVDIEGEDSYNISYPLKTTAAFGLHSQQRLICFWW